MPTKRQVCEFAQLSASALDRALAAGRVQSIKLGTGKSAPVRIPRDALLADLGLIEKTPRRSGRDKQAEAEMHRAAAKFGIALGNEVPPGAATQ